MSTGTPPRPADVPATATYDARSALWREDTDSAVRRWYRDGQPLLDAQTRDGKLHGALTWYENHPDYDYPEATRRAAHALLAEYDIPTGPAITQRIDAIFDAGAITTATFHGYPYPKIALIASWQAGKLHGRFEWDIITSGDIIRFGDTVVGAHDVKLPKPHPDRGVSEYVAGKRKSTAFFDEDGTERVKVTPLKQWGEDATRATIAGYVARGDLERDLAAFFPSSRRVTELPADALPLARWIDRLPAPHRPAAQALDALIRGGRFPWLGQRLDISDTYGLDCLAQALPGATDARYVGLSADGSGNLHLLDLTTGRVLAYEHESDDFDARRGFPDLDTYAFAMPRIEAAASKRIPKKKLADLFRSLGLTTAVSELD